MAKIQLTRTCNLYSAARDIKVYSDGQQIGTISDGETREFNIPAGKHTLRAKFDWRGSRDFILTINDNETKNISISVLKYESYLLGATGGIMLLHSFLNYKFKINFIIWLAFPALLALFCLITFGRNYYLNLQDSESDISREIINRK